MFLCENSDFFVAYVYTFILISCYFHDAIACYVWSDTCLDKSNGQQILILVDQSTLTNDSPHEMHIPGNYLVDMQNAVTYQIYLR